MPRAALKACQYRGCAGLARGHYCDKHKRERPAALRQRQRVNPYGHMYDRRWRRASKAFLAEHPLCVDCEARGQLTPATQVDHIVPHKGDYQIFWDRSNWQGLCHSDHSKKTAKEDGGFGREKNEDHHRA